MKDKLTTREMRFAIEYAKGTSAKNSAVKAGYKEKSAGFTAEQAA